MKSKVIRVTMTVDYVVPMNDEKTSIINNWTPEEVAKSWFEDYDINRSHATRDIYRIGNGTQIKSYEIIDS